MQEENTNYTPPVYPTDKPIINKPKKAIPTFIGIAIIVLAAVVVFGGVFAWQYFVPKPQAVVQPQNQNQTAGWKTYTNTQYGFEFKYPSKLLDEISGYPIDGATKCEISNEWEKFPSLMVFQGKSKLEGRFTNIITMRVRVLCKQMDILRELGWPGSGRYGEKYLQPIKIGNKSGYKYTDAVPTSSIVYITNYVELESNVLEINFGIDEQYTDEDMTKEILSTFKITK